MSPTIRLRYVATLALAAVPALSFAQAPKEGSYALAVCPSSHGDVAVNVRALKEETGGFEVLGLEFKVPGVKDLIKVATTAENDVSAVFIVTVSDEAGVPHYDRQYSRRIELAHPAVPFSSLGYDLVPQSGVAYGTDARALTADGESCVVNEENARIILDSDM